MVWGIEAGNIGATFGMRQLRPGTYGWENLEVGQARASFELIESICRNHGWDVHGEVRPHSRYFALMEAFERGPRGGGTVDLGSGAVFWVGIPDSGTVRPYEVETTGGGLVTAVRVYLG